MIHAPDWTLAGGRALRPAPFLVAGILNLTPDSFSDGGSWTDVNAAVAHARELWQDGAHMIDVGAESTRPGSDFIDGDEELARLRPVLEKILAGRANWHADARPLPEGREPLPYPLLSVDTWRAGTAHAVLDMGVEIINDISGGSFDPAMDEVVASHAPGYVLMHCPEQPRTMQKAPHYENVTDAVMDFFESRMRSLVRAGLPESRIALDPGIGFGKTPDHNLELMRSVPRLRTLGRPLYYGISRKGFFGKLLNIPLAERDGPTQVLTALLAAKGVFIHRVHDAKGCARALDLVTALAAPLE